MQRLYTKSTSSGTSITVSDTTGYISDGIYLDCPSLLSVLQTLSATPALPSLTQGTLCNNYISVYATPVSLPLISSACINETQLFLSLSYFVLTDNP